MSDWLDMSRLPDGQIVFALFLTLDVGNCVLSGKKENGVFMANTKYGTVYVGEPLGWSPTYP